MQIGSQTHAHIEKIQMFIQGLFQAFVVIVLNIFFNLKIAGADEALQSVRNAKKHNKGVLFASNHISEWDAILVRCCLPWAMFTNPMYYVAMTKDHYQYAKFGLRRFLYGGTFFKILGAYPAYLGMRDYHASLVNHIELLEHGKSVCIFPEGKISVDTAHQTEAKGGIAFLAEQTKTDIIPVQCIGLKQINWKNILLFKRPTIEIRYKKIVSIDMLIAESVTAGFSIGPEMYKHIASNVMKSLYLN